MVTQSNDANRRLFGDYYLNRKIRLDSIDTEVRANRSSG